MISYFVMYNFHMLFDVTAVRGYEVAYEGKDEKSFTSLIAMQPLVADHALMPHLKAMYVPFHMAYSGLICSKGLQSDRPK